MPRTRHTMHRSSSGRSRAGSKGGKTTASRRGRSFYQEIGRKGGSSRGRAGSR